MIKPILSCGFYLTLSSRCELPYQMPVIIALQTGVKSQIGN